MPSWMWEFSTLPQLTIWFTLNMILKGKNTHNTGLLNSFSEPVPLSLLHCVHMQVIWRRGANNDKINSKSRTNVAFIIAWCSSQLWWLLKLRSLIQNHLIYTQSTSHRLTLYDRLIISSDFVHIWFNESSGCCIMLHLSKILTFFYP